MTLDNEIYLGDYDGYNAKLKILADLAQPEIWSFGKDREEQPYKILKNYFEHTYRRLKEEDKLLISSDGEHMCMNTGLLTKFHQEIIAMMGKSSRSGSEPWYLVGFFKETDQRFRSCFYDLPKIADYTDNVRDLIFDKNLFIDLNKEHIIGDNYNRFTELGYTSEEMISYMLDAAKGVLLKKLLRNFKLALPFYYRDKKTGNDRIQLLAPLFFPSSSVRLALVLDKCTSENKPYYLARTVLYVEWAYMNARLIARPDEEWARIMDDLDETGVEVIP